MTFNKNNNSIFIIAILITIISGCATRPVVDSESFALTTPRYAHAAVNDGKKIYVFAGSNRLGFRSDIEIIDPFSKKIEVLTRRLIPRRYFSTIWDGNHSIYILGGVSVVNKQLRDEKRVEVFDTLTHEISFSKSIPLSTRINSAVFLDGRIFVFGGTYSKGKRLVATPIVGVFDIAEHEWKRMADMPTAKATRAVVKDGLIYVAGGYDEKSSLDVFERFNPKTNVWESLTPIPEKISDHSVTVVKEKLFLFGNYNDLTSTYCYDFISQQL
ncbi:MAG: hypothetical protein L3J46_07180 [Kangiellaceae bacterium]|nr:hypothetical protein [Kangiellaceae bacterium]